MKHTEPSSQDGSTLHLHDLRIQSALEQAAMYAVNVAATRWTSGHSYAELELMRALAPSPQARWHAATQAGFTAWLNAGGFTQAEAEAPQAPPAAPETAAAPAGQLHEAGCPV